MKMPEVPDSVDRQALIDAFATLGLDITNTLQITIDPRVMTLTYARLDSRGRLLAAGDGVATITVKVGTPVRKSV
jgi:hypothetical protein